MDFPRFFQAYYCLMYLVIVYLPLAYGQLVPALFIFGDSVVDVGNNNFLPTIVKSDFLPYGRDFNNSKPTGRFCNGKLTTDFIADILGFSSYPPAYLSNEAKGKNLIIGANFASAASGYYESTALLYQAIPLSKQVDNYKEYQGKLVELIGKANATTSFSTGIHLISSGSSDFIQNYYISPLLQAKYTPDHFSGILLENYAKFIQDLYDLGARKIGVTSLPPIGCLPASITLFGLGSNKCIDRLNNDAYSFNQKLKSASQSLQKSLSGLKLIVFDAYKALYDIVQNPDKNGFVEARRGCCGTGYLETSFLCNKLSLGTCGNASQYIFWDAFHPSEAANSLISQNLSVDGLSLID